MRQLCGCLGGALLIAAAASAHAGAPPVPTVVHIEIAAEITVHLELAGIDAVGFTHKPRTSAERDAASRVVEVLGAATDWLRFNTAAQCRLSTSSIGANLYHADDPDAPKSAPRLTRPAFDAHFTFTCDAMSALRTLDIALIERFPRVGEVIADVRAPKSHHAEIVTTPTGTVWLTTQ